MTYGDISQCIFIKAHSNVKEMHDYTKVTVCFFAFCLIWLQCKGIDYMIDTALITRLSKNHLTIIFNILFLHVH